MPKFKILTVVYVPVGAVGVKVAGVLPVVVVVEVVVAVTAAQQ